MNLQTSSVETRKVSLKIPLWKVSNILSEDFREASAYTYLLKTTQKIYSVWRGIFPPWRYKIYFGLLA